MAGGVRKLGTSMVEISADIAPLEARLAEAKRIVEQFEAEYEAAKTESAMSDEERYQATLQRYAGEAEEKRRLAAMEAQAAEARSSAVSAEAESFSSGVRQAEAQVQASTQKMGDDISQNVGGGFRAPLQELGRFRSLVSKTAGTIGLIVAPLVAAARVTVELSKAAMGVNKEFSNSLDTLRGLQDQVQTIRDKIAGVYDDQTKQIAELRNQIAQLGSVTIEQQRQQAGMIAKLIDQTLIDPSSTSLGDGVAKVLANTLQGMSELTGLGQGFYEDMAAAAKAQRDAIDKGVTESIKATREAEKEANAKAIRDTEEATQKLAEKNAATMDKLLGMVAEKNVQAVGELYAKESQLRDIAHAARMDNIAREHEAMMRAVEEYRRAIVGPFTASRGVNQFGDIKDLLETIANRI